MKTFNIVVGPSDDPPNHRRASAVQYLMMLQSDDEDVLKSRVESGGWEGPGPRCSNEPNAWLSYARRHLNLPKEVKNSGLNWAHARVRPYGYSQGAGHSPQGIQITWSWTEK